MPTCDAESICGTVCNNEATHDAKTVRGPWGYLCKDHLRLAQFPCNPHLTRRIAPITPKTPLIGELQIQLETVQFHKAGNGKINTLAISSDNAETIDNIANILEILRNG